MQPSAVRGYLEEVRTHLHLDFRTQRRVINELSTYFQEKLADLAEQGMAESDAVPAAIASCGDPRSIARLTDEAHSRGTWMEAFIGCQPHFILAALFATHLWRYPALLGAAFAAIVVIALAGWRIGSPSWLYSWVGYAGLPLLTISYLSIVPVARTVQLILGGQGTPASVLQIALLLALYVFTLWLIASTAVSVARRDWILLSLMLLPLPVLGVWLIMVTQSPGFLLDTLRGITEPSIRWDGAMAGFFFTLGVTTALFVRMRRRALKGVVVIAVGILGSASAARSFWSGLGAVQLAALALCLLLFLTIPFFLQAILGHDQNAKHPLPS
jgi:hypothetical protein